MIFVLSTLIGAKEIRLSIANDSDCGGSRVRLHFRIPNQQCLTSYIDSFSAGDTLVWKDSTLGDCERQMIYNRNTTVAVESTADDPFCPRELLILAEDDNEMQKRFMVDISEGYPEHKAALHNQILHQIFPVDTKNNIIKGKQLDTLCYGDFNTTNKTEQS